MNFLLLNHAIALFLTFFAATFVGLLVLSKGHKKKENMAYLAWSLSVAGWAFFLAFGLIADSPSTAIIFFKIMWPFVTFIPVSTSHFVVSFLDIKGKEWFIRTGYILTALLALLSFTDYVPANLKPIGYIKFFPGVNFIEYIRFALFTIYLCYQLYVLILAHKISTGTKRNQIAYVFWASLLGYTGGSSNYLLVFGLFIPVFHPFATYLLVLYPLIVAYAILRYQLMDIKLVVKKTLIYSVSIALISGFIISISFLSSWLAEKIPGFRFWTVPLIAGIAAFIIGRIFWRKSQETEKLKYEFITVAAHKLRTPLTEIRWGVDALEDEIKSPEFNKNAAHKLISEIKSADLQLIELTEDLLKVSKAESNQYQYKFETYNLEKIARPVVNSFQFQMKEKHIKLFYNIEKDLPEVGLDKIRISSVIQTLLENAILYTKNEIKINIDSYKDYVIFHIEDNGIGVKKEDQPYIFSKFFRSHKAYLTETEGIGIGLFLAKTIIEKHNGKIGVKSEGEGRGSVFWFSLKAA